MEILKTSSVKNQIFRYKTKKEKTNELKKQTKDIGNKVELTLSALAATGAAIAEGAINLRKNINSKTIDNSAKQAQKIAEQTLNTAQSGIYKTGVLIGIQKGKLSGNINKRLEEIKQDEFLNENLVRVSSKNINAIKKLNPKFIEEVDNNALVLLLNHKDINRVVSTLNGISPKTVNALKKSGVIRYTFFGLANCEKPTIENIKGTYHLDNGLQAYEILQKQLKIYESQFIRVKLLDKVFDPKRLQNTKGNQLSVLKIWIGSNLKASGFGEKDRYYFDNFYYMLKKEALNKDKVNFEYIMDVANKL